MSPTVVNRDPHIVIAEIREAYAGHEPEDIVNVSAGALSMILDSLEALLQDVDKLQGAAGHYPRWQTTG
jgi:hypothetical protein